jgi:hypothetical protein
MPQLTQAEQTDMQKRLAIVRDQALSNLNALVKQERAAIWQQYHQALEMIGLDKDGKPKKVQ